MNYRVKRFAATEEYQSETIRESTVNGKTKGEVVLSRGKRRTGHKPVVKTVKLKYDND